MRYLFLVLSLCCNLALAEVPPLANSYVVDQVGVLSKTDIGEINSSLKALDTTGKAVMGVMVTNDSSLDSLTIAEAWKLGHQGKQDGLILLVNPAEHKSRLEVGRGLSGDLTDIWSKQVLDRAGQLFKRTEYKTGIMHVAEQIDGRLVVPLTGTAEEDHGGVLALVVLAIIVVVGGGVFTLWWLDVKDEERQEEEEAERLRNQRQADRDAYMSVKPRYSSPPPVATPPRPSTNWNYAPPAPTPKKTVTGEVTEVIEDAAIAGLAVAAIDSLFGSSSSSEPSYSPSRDDDTSSTYDGGGSSSSWRSSDSSSSSSSSSDSSSSSSSDSSSSSGD